MDVVKPTALRFWTLASLVTNQLIVVTGALVRLTGSGLGCPTWPQCSPGSYTPHAALGMHGAIEFGNRLITFVLAAVAIATFIVAVRAVRHGAADRRIMWLALAAGLGIPLQAVIGGISVLTQLNPWVVGLHMVVSIAIIAICVAMVQMAYDVRTVVAPSRSAAWASRIVTVLGVAVLALGVVTTGSGPNAGDGGATRNGLSLELVAKAHAWVAIALVAATVWALVTLWNTAVRRAVIALLAVEGLQAVVGYVQYFTHLPLGVVMTHMLGTAVFSAVLANFSLRILSPPR